MKKMTQERIDRALSTLRGYRKDRAELDGRILANEEYWKLRHTGAKRESGFERVCSTGWLFNSIMSKHADVMDSHPSPIILPREQGDEKSAEELSLIIPAVLDLCSFDRTWSECWYDKLKNGTAVYAVLWNQEKENGMGDIDIRRIDIMSLFWENGVSDINDSKNLFLTSFVDSESLEAKYPHLRGKKSRVSIIDEQDIPDGKTLVVDWYYKKSVGGKHLLHYCKIARGECLYCSEDSEIYRDRGYYDHGKYPFVFDKLHTVSGSPCGFGYIDLLKETQDQIDKLTYAIQENSLQGTRRRWFIKGDGKINEEEMSSWHRPFVHFYGSGDVKENLMPIEIPTLSEVYVDYLENRIDELKEISANRDFTQGGTMGGVTAASAIAALQEAGSKLARDMINGGFNAYRDIITLCIELIAQFYTEKRSLRIIGENGERSYLSFDNGILCERAVIKDGAVCELKRPIFDIKVVCEKKSPYSTVSQNELAKELFSIGAFDPSKREQALTMLKMMSFEGKEAIIKTIEGKTF